MDDMGRRTANIVFICLVAAVVAGGLAFAKGAQPAVAVAVAGAAGTTLLILIIVLMWRE